MKFIRRNLFLLTGILFVFFFFHKFFLQGLLPIPTDTIVGLYHPYRDFYSAEYPRGIPFQNMQVSDPVRQQYLWRELAVSQMKNGQLPLWNPYNFSGYPLLANFQSAVFYPLNLLMFVVPFEYAWTLLIISQPLLAFVFMFIYLRNLKLSQEAALVGSISFGFSGFFVSWLEWGNVVSTGLWLPLILLSTDKILNFKKRKEKILWSSLLLFSLCASFLAGHLQTFFYLFLLSFAYLILRWFENKKSVRKIFLFVFYYLVFGIITAIQWVPTLQFVNLSARSFDQVSTNIEGWFIPWQNLSQFIAPDFFGNPATLNYWGVWNYGEFIGYVGILPLILALGIVIFKRERIVLFFGLLIIIGVAMAFPSPLSNLPFKFDLPFISTSQPTRIMYLINVSLAVLSAIGFDYFVKKPKRLFVPIVIIGAILTSFWVYVKFNDFLPANLQSLPENLAVSFSNLRLPTIIFITLLLLWTVLTLSAKNKNKKYLNLILLVIIIVFAVDIFRFADKYTVFSEKEYLYPKTRVIEFLESNSTNSRIMEADARILPPNFTVSFSGESIDGYDPLYILRYGELAAAISRGEPNINPPFGFNRIITPQTYHDPTINGLNVKYLLSLTEIEDDGYIKVFEEGETKIYENKEFIDKAFFVDRTISAENKYDAIEKYFENKYDLKSVAIVEGSGNDIDDKKWSLGEVDISEYSENRIVISVNNDKDGFLVLLDSFYPTWRVTVDGVEQDILLTNYNFRGVVVPGGANEVIFTNHLF